MGIDEETAAEKVRRRSVCVTWQGCLTVGSPSLCSLVGTSPLWPQKKVVRRDLKDIDVEEYTEARRSRGGWMAPCRLGMESHRGAEVVRASVAVREVVCEVRSWTFRRESDCKRH